MKTSITLLGTNIPLELTRQPHETLNRLLDADHCQHIVTINPEFLVQAYHDQSYRTVLNQSQAATVDGFGVILMATLTGQGSYGLRRITGVQLTQHLLTIAENRSLRVCVIIPKKALADPDEISRALRKQYPKLQFQIIQEDGLTDSPILADVVFVTFGSPRQDVWINQNRSTLLAHAKIAVGVGGTFDFLSGKIMRAPLPMRFLGLEWLWRLLVEPRRRLRRILRAVIVFPWLVLTARSSKR